MEKTDNQLASALRLVTGALAATMAHHRIKEDTPFAFTGEWEHLGRHTLADALDVANAALEAPVQPLTPYTAERMRLCAMALGWEYRPEIIGGLKEHWTRPMGDGDMFSNLAAGRAHLGEMPTHLMANTADEAVRHDLGV